MDAPHAGIETEMLETREAKMRALIHARVYWRHPSGVQYAAIVTRAFSPECVNLLVLGDHGIDLGAGPGSSLSMGSVVLGEGHYNWQTELDA